MKKMIKCWEFFACEEEECPVYIQKELRCWLVPGTHCRNEIQGKFIEKVEMCLQCEPFRMNMDIVSLEETLDLVNEQFTQFGEMVEERDRELEGISMELAMGLSEVFVALKQISSGDPLVRIPETSELELIAKLKHIVNLTAQNLGEIVDLSHEFAMGLSEHFGVLDRVSKGDLTARISGDSHVELLESLKRVTNQTIGSVSIEITERKRAQEALRKSHEQLERRVEERTAELAKSNILLGQEISERKQAEERILRRNARLDAINRVLQETLTRKTHQEVARTCLTVAEELTGSKFGFIGEVNQAGHFDTIALSDPGWKACRIPKTSAVVMLKDMEVRGIWGQVLKSEKSLIVNNPVSDPNSVGTPEGHAPISCFLGVPLKRPDAVIGMIGLANKESGYDPVDQRTIEALSPVFVEALYSKRADEALRESEAKSRLILQTVPSGLFTVDLNRKVTSWNKGAEEITGLKAEDVIGEDCLEALDCAECRKGCALFDDTVDKPIHGKECVVYADGRAIALSKNADFLIDSEGNAIGGLESFVDITERKEVEDALRASEEKYRSLVESTEDSVYLVDSHCTYLFMNEKHLSRFSLPQDKVIGRTYGEFHSQEETKTFIEKVNEVIETGQSLWHEYESQRDSRYFLRTLSPVKGADGRVIAVTVISKDITERKRLEAQLQHAQRMEAIGTLAGGIAHNFNNLLMGIQGYTSLMLLGTPPTDLNYSKLKNIEKLIQGGSKLTSQLIGYAREGKYEVRAVSLNQLVKETSDTFAMTKKQIRVHQELAADLSGIKADQGQIEQVLWNLYVNAADAMPDGGDLFLRTKNVTHEDMGGKLYKPKGGKYVMLTVTDTGVGMDNKTMERVFDPFFTTKETGHGSGLGLASAYGIIKAHGGYIDLDSKRGHGTTLTIYLPASEEMIYRAVRPSEPLIKGIGTVLLVDDEAFILEVGRELLEAMGYKVVLARDGEEAIQVYSKKWDNIDIVVLDMVMPNMGGGEAYDRMKEINPDIKALLSSGFSINGEATEILERGCNGFIQKPFTMKQLSGKIGEILEKP